MNKAVIVTGGARRVGRDLCLYLADKGYDIALHYNASAKEAAEVRKEVLAKGVKCELFQMNLRKFSEYQMFMESVKKALPNVSALINSASVYKPDGFTEGSEDVFDEHFEVNLKAPYFLTKAFAQVFKKGAVVNITDTNITKTRHSYFSYLLSKKAFHQFTMMAANLLAPEIRVNEVAPGTMLPDEKFGWEKMDALKDKLPLKKLATTQALAEAVLMLVENENLCGQTIFVDGGQSLI